MSKLKVIFSILSLAILLASCGKSDEVSNENFSPVIDDNVLLDAVLDPAVVAGNGSVVDDVLYIDIDIEDLSEPVAHALRQRDGNIEMGNDLNLTATAIANILNGKAGGTTFSSGILVPAGSFVEMPLNTTQANPRGPCRHWCRCWEDSFGNLVCIDISICM
ncbi:MAG: hypothetical protein AAFP19_00660 [Bacteroidota bacterium]